MASDNVPLKAGSRRGVSVIIPTYNGEKTLEKLFIMLARQTCPVAEILVIDSSSSDASRELARRQGAKVVQIPAAQFDHGSTRTMAGRMAVGEILVYLTQDAVPAADDALEKLVRSLRGDDRIAAAYGRQLANDDATCFSEHLRLFNYPPGSYVRCWEDRHTHGFKTIFISNSFAAYRKSALETCGYFPEKMIFGEDTCTVAHLLESGYCVAYAADACVYHSHNYSLTEDFRRYFDIGVLHSGHHDLFGKFGNPKGAGKKFVLSEWSFLLERRKYHLLFESLLRILAKYIAYHAGKKHTSLPPRLAACLSMHRNWWHER